MDHQSSICNGGTITAFPPGSTAETGSHQNGGRPLSHHPGHLHPDKQQVELLGFQIDLYMVMNGYTVASTQPLEGKLWVVRLSGRSSSSSPGTRSTILAHGVHDPTKNEFTWSAQPTGQCRPLTGSPPQHCDGASITAQSLSPSHGYSATLSSDRHAWALLVFATTPCLLHACTSTRRASQWISANLFVSRKNRGSVLINVPRRSQCSKV